MALIKCPECGKEISDKSKQCIHCGFPLPTVEDVPDGFCLIDGVPRDLREALNKIDDYPTMTPDEQKYSCFLFCPPYRTFLIVFFK